ncbi:MAG: Flp family type IVb pilin [Actinobacteria bacterium]|nr:MAG: Flp family type IVb pilin [Actinomycetota bacterium]
MELLLWRPKCVGHLSDEAGQALVEYALILMLVALVAVTALTAIGINVLTVLTSVANGL